MNSQARDQHQGVQAQRLEGRQARRSHQLGDQGEHPDRRDQADDAAGQAHHRLESRFEEAQQRLAMRPLQRADGDAQNDGEEDDRQHLRLRGRREDVLRHNVENQVHR